MRSKLAPTADLESTGFLYRRSTALHATDAHWDFSVRYNGDIYAVNRSGGSGTELHILSAASDYQHVTTGLHATDGGVALTRTLAVAVGCHWRRQRSRDLHR